MTEINPNNIAPSQNFLKEGTVRFILRCLDEGNESDLPPSPIVRSDESGHLVAIDGHNLLAVRAYRGESQQVHVASSPEDGLPDTDESNRQRNADLREKFEQCIQEREKAKSGGVNSFGDLIAKYPQLFEVKA